MVPTLVLAAMDRRSLVLNRRRRVRVSLGGFVAPVAASSHMLYLALSQGLSPTLAVIMVLAACAIAYSTSSIYGTRGLMMPVATLSFVSAALLSLPLVAMQRYHLLPLAVPAATVLGVSAVDLASALRYGGMVAGGYGFRDAVFLSLPLSAASALAIGVIAAP